MLILQFLTLSQAVTSASNLPRNSGSILATSLVFRGLALLAALGTGGNAAKNISGKCIFFLFFSNCSLLEADYDDGGDKIEEEESAVKFHLEVQGS